jgi:hypothetical protein
MEDSQETEMNNEVLSIDLIQHDKLRHSSAVSKILKMAIKRYQFDVIGWTKYCIDNKDLKQKALPVYRHKPLENLRIQDKILTSLSTPPIKKVYESPNHYIRWLDEEYVRDQAFYEAILKNPSKSKTDFEDNLLNKEIDHSAKEYLKTIEKRKIDEEALIRGIQIDNWLDIKMSKYPKVQLGIILGATGEAIVNNFCLYFINQLKAFLASSKTAFLSLTGPATWYEIDQCKAELAYFKKEVVDPIVKNLK